MERGLFRTHCRAAKDSSAWPRGTAIVGARKANAMQHASKWTSYETIFNGQGSLLSIDDKTSTTVDGLVKKCAAIGIIAFHNCIHASCLNQSGWPSNGMRGGMCDVGRHNRGHFFTRVSMQLASNPSPTTFAQRQIHALPEAAHEWHALFATQRNLRCMRRPICF